MLDNQALIAYEGYPVTAEDTEIVVNFTGKDTDDDGDPLAVIEITQPSPGTAAVSGTNQVTYTPILNYDGGDSCGYTVSLFSRWQ